MRKKSGFIGVAPQLDLAILHPTDTHEPAKTHQLVYYGIFEQNATLPHRSRCTGVYTTCILISWRVLGQRSKPNPPFWRGLLAIAVASRDDYTDMTGGLFLLKLPHKNQLLAYAGISSSLTRSSLDLVPPAFSPCIDSTTIHNTDTLLPYKRARTGLGPHLTLQCTTR